MADLDKVWSKARDDLTVMTDASDEDHFLWEHSARVATSASAFAALGSLKSRRPDADAVTAAALYHDFGWVVRLRAGEICRGEILLRQLPDMHREQGAAQLEASLAGLLPSETLHRAADAIRMMGNRDGGSLEAWIVSDADNLDDFGPLALWPAIRRGLLDGKGVQSVIDTWRRRTEYQFWAARLNDSFHLAEVRAIAESRFSDYERVMEALERHHTAADVHGKGVPAGKGERALNVPR